jgi:hypothetical protein
MNIEFLNILKSPHEGDKVERRQIEEMNIWKCHNETPCVAIFIFFLVLYFFNFFNFNCYGGWWHTVALRFTKVLKIYQIFEFISTTLLHPPFPTVSSMIFAFTYLCKLYFIVLILLNPFSNTSLS